MDILHIIAERVKEMVSENQFISGVILFGSIARGEEHGRSDIDLLILWENLRIDPSERYIYIYRIVSKYFPSTNLTLLDIEYSSFLNARKITPLLLNIIYDGIVLYDKYGKLEDFLSRVKRELETKGIKRRKIGRYYYWMLPEAGSKVRLEV